MEVQNARSEVEYRIQQSLKYRITRSEIQKGVQNTEEWMQQSPGITQSTACNSNMVTRTMQQQQEHYKVHGTEYRMQQQQRMHQSPRYTRVYTRHNKECNKVRASQSASITKSEHHKVRGMQQSPRYRRRYRIQNATKSEHHKFRGTQSQSLRSRMERDTHTILRLRRKRTIKQIQISESFATGLQFPTPCACACVCVCMCVCVWVCVCVYVWMCVNRLPFRTRVHRNNHIYTYT